MDRRFQKCRDRENNANVGFSGPPECDQQVIPEPDGSCVHVTTERGALAPPSTVEVSVEALRAALALLKPLAARRRFAGDSPITVGVGRGGLTLHATDGESEAVVTQGATGISQRVVIPLERCLQALEAEGIGNGVVTLAVPDDQHLRVGATLLVAGTPPDPVPAGSAPLQGDAGWEVPPLPANCTYLTKALSPETSTPGMRYVLLELPAFTFVATDGRRLHSQHLRPEWREAPVLQTLLLTQDQLALLWTPTLTRKALRLTAQGCHVSGMVAGLHVAMQFTTGTGAFPEWRPLLTGYGPPLAMPLAGLRELLKGDGLFQLPTPPHTRVRKAHLRDALTGWGDALVQFRAIDARSPVLMEGQDRSAVVVYAPEVPVGQTASQATAGRKKQAETGGKAAGPVSPAGAAPGEMSAPATLPLQVVPGQKFIGEGGEYEVVKAQVFYLVKVPAGDKRWFVDDGIRRLWHPPAKPAQPAPAAGGQAA